MFPVLYPPNATDFSTFGLGVLTDTISCEVTEERNGGHAAGGHAPQCDLGDRP